LPHHVRRHVVFRRRREAKTDYRKRRGMILAGKPRFVVRTSLKHVNVQVINAEPEGDKTLTSAHSSQLGKFGWKATRGNTPAAYLTGFLAGLKALSIGVKEAFLDVGLRKPSKGSKIFAALKGATDAGLKIPHDEKIFPEDARIAGGHIASFTEKLSKEKPEIYKTRFSQYLKNKMAPEKLPDHFVEVKEKISASFKSGEPHD